MGLLAIECILVFMFHSSGWNGTLGSLRWLAALLASVLPLLVILTLLGRNGRRFGLKSLLAATSLVAVFLAVFLLPYTRAKRSREKTQSLKISGIRIHTESKRDEYYATLGVGGNAPLGSEVSETAFWIEPLLVDLPAVQAEAIREIDLWSDEQIKVAMRQIADLPNLRKIRVFGLKDGLTVTCATADGLTELSHRLPPTECLDIIDVMLPVGCCKNFTNVKMLHLHANGVNSPLYALTESQLRDVASTPGMEVLHISGCIIDDQAAAILSDAPRLRCLELWRTQVSESASSRIQERHPQLTIRLMD